MASIQCKMCGGAEQDHAEAAKRYRKAAEQGNERAKDALDRLGK